jgi:cytochrome b involved in lipid metabolism
MADIDESKSTTNQPSPAAEPEPATAPEPESPAARMTRDEVMQDARMLVIYDNCVYDVSEFAASHPGGRELLEEYANRDCTEDFDLISHSTAARKLLGGMKVCDVAESDHI